MRIAILRPSATLPAPEFLTSLDSTDLEVLDFYWNESLESAHTARAFLVLADPSELKAAALAQPLIRFLKEQNDEGKAILGLGPLAAALLVDSGLVPGIYKNLPAFRLCLPEDQAKRAATSHPETAWIQPAEHYQYNAFTQRLVPGQILPVRHSGQAEFHLPPGLRLELEAQGQLVFAYCDAAGQPLPGNAIAAVSNKAGTIMALLPEPEAVTGAALLQSLQAHLKSGYRERVEPLAYWPRK